MVSYRDFTITFLPNTSSHTCNRRITIVLTLLRLTATAAVGAAAIYYSEPWTKTQSPSSPSSSPPAHPASPEPSKANLPGHRHEAAYASDVPKPVEDRHGDTVAKHSIAAHKNQNKVREGKFSKEEFDNHVQVHSPGEPGGDFEKK